MKKEIVKYELSEDGVGLVGFFADGTYYHIHSDELTKIEKQILEWLLQHSIPEAIENRIKKLKEVIKVQCSKGNYDSNEYMRGMANGLILAEAILEDKDPEYCKENPEKEEIKR